MRLLARVTLFCILVLLVVSIPRSIHAEEDSRPVLYSLDGTFDVRWGSTTLTFSNFPLSVRSVPRHPDDGYLGSEANDPLPDSVLVLRQVMAQEFIFLAQPWPTPVSIGVIMGSHSPDIWHRNSQQRYQQNQFGTSERGYGTALRWYQVNVGSLQASIVGFYNIPRQYLTPGIYIRGRIGGVVDVTGVQLVTESGWDRYDSDELWKQRTLGRLREHRAVARMEVGVVSDRDATDPAVRGSFYVFFEYALPWNQVQVGGNFRGLKHAARNSSHLTLGLGLTSFRE